MWTPIMFSLEILALILIVLLIVKISFLLVKPKAWLSVVKVIYAKPIVTVIVEAILAYIALTSLISLGMTYTEFFAVALLVTLLMGMSFAVYSKEMIELGKKMLKDKKFWKKAWFPVLIWVILAVLALNEMYAWF